MIHLSTGDPDFDDIPEIFFTKIEPFKTKKAKPDLIKRGFVRSHFKQRQRLEQIMAKRGWSYRRLCEEIGKVIGRECTDIGRISRDEASNVIGEWDNRGKE